MLIPRTCNLDPHRHFYGRMLSPEALLFPRPNGSRSPATHFFDKFCTPLCPRWRSSRLHIGVIGWDTQRIWSACSCGPHHKTHRRRSPVGYCGQFVGRRAVAAAGQAAGQARGRQAMEKAPIMAHSQSFPSDLSQYLRLLQAFYPLLSRPPSAHSHLPRFSK